jgi:hypothetical protein
MAESRGSFGSGARRVFSIAGFALNFAGRRTETIMRVSWLPVTILLILNMATVFATLSVATGRPISFADAATYQEVLQAHGMLQGIAWATDWQMMSAITATSAVLQMILLSSFMAPLTRYAGLGEKPSPGVVKLPFGPDQVRFSLAYVFSFYLLPLILVAPIAVTADNVLRYLNQAIDQIHVLFPDPESLHTVDIITNRGGLAVAKGELWKHTLPPTLALAGVFWGLLIAHFSPADPRARKSILRRAFLALVIGAVAVVSLRFAIPLAQPQAALVDNEQILVFLALAVSIVGYGSLRMLPYAGVATCKRKLGFAGVGRVTRRWRIVELFFAIVLIGALLYGVLFFLGHAYNALAAAFNAAYLTVDSGARLANGGASRGWVQPAFALAGSLLGILINIFWAFFTYGVLAGLIGRLHRDSETLSK